jgi:hypothetical protein
MALARRSHRLHVPAGPPPYTALHHAFRVLISYAITDPGGHVEHALRENGFLVPELTTGYIFGEGSH